jgi:hypothetical protein
VRPHIHYRTRNRLLPGRIPRPSSSKLAPDPAPTGRIKVRVLSGSQLELLDDVERFLSMIRFDGREKLKDLPLEKGK